MDAQTCIMTRRSHRKYTNKKVSHEEIEKIISLAAYAGVEDSTLIMPGGATVPDEDQDLIAYEPYYDSSDYDLEPMPEEGEMRPASTVQSVPEEDVSVDTAHFDPGA